MKSCKDTIPRSVWETYSSFANTRGGVILLGITENKEQNGDSRFEITGVEDSYKVETDFWNIVNNPQKVNTNILVDSDFRVISVDGKPVIYIRIPEADYHKKPIYINNNLQSGTYKRNHEGDRHVTMDELALLMRDSSDDIDSQIIEHYSMDDIDVESLANYRQSFKSLNPAHAYTQLGDLDFLRQMGGYRVDRHHEVEGLTMAGLLMFGKRLALQEVFPAFRVDYLDLINVSPGDSLKWNDRLTDDGRWEPNIYNFATLVMRKLLFSLPSEGRLHGTTRVDGGVLHEAVREAIVNALTYCDYKVNGVLRIDRRTDSIIFRNPGTLRISPERIYSGDFTLARNRTIQQMFRMIGYGDNIGSGFQKILAAWRYFGFPTPELKEIAEVNEVWLILPLSMSKPGDVENDVENGSDVENDVENDIKSRRDVENDIENISDRQRAILEIIKVNKTASAKEISELLSISHATAQREIRQLRGKHILLRVGSDKGGSWKIIAK